MVADELQLGLRKCGVEEEVFLLQTRLRSMRQVVELAQGASIPALLVGRVLEVEFQTRNMLRARNRVLE